MKEAEGVMEMLKERDMIEWVQRTNGSDAQVQEGGGSWFMGEMMEAVKGNPGGFCGCFQNANNCLEDMCKISMP